MLMQSPHKDRNTKAFVFVCDINVMIVFIDCIAISG